MSNIQRFVSLNRAVDLYKKCLVKYDCTESEKDIAERMMLSVKYITKNRKVYLAVDELKTMLENFYLAVEEKDAALLNQRRGLKRKIVSIDEFVNSKEYADQKRSVRPAIMKALNEFWDPSQYFVEAVFGGAIGVGKDYFAAVCMMYMLYNLSCYHNPQLEYGFAPGSGIIFIQQSKTEKLAKKVMFDQFTEMLKHSKYFRENFMFNTKIKSELQFPKNISVLPVGGNDTAALGMNVFAATIDEMNFMERVKDSVHTRYTGEDEYDQAERVYNALRRRIKSRFMFKGKIPGKLVLLSSKNYDGDFTDKKREERDNQLKETGTTDIYMVELAQWESIPADRFSGEKFLVEVGDDTRRSRIVRYRSEAKDKDKVIEIPVEYLTDFQRDIEGALKDLGGRSVGSRSPFIPYRELITEAMKKHKKEFEGRSLFKYNKITLSVDNPEIQEFREFDEVVDESYIDDYLFDILQAFAVHIDVGLNREGGDAAGLAISRIFGYTKLPEYKYYNPKIKEFVEVKELNVPIYCVDGVLQINAQRGDEINLNLVRDLVLYIKQRVNIKWATLDTYQSQMMIQAFRTAKIRSGNLSVDTSIAPYTEYKLSIKDGRILLPTHEILHKETREIEKVKDRDRVDHPPNGGTKDVSDAVAGSIYMLQHKEAQYYGSRRSRRSEEQRPVQKIKVLGRKEVRRTRMGIVQ